MAYLVPTTRRNSGSKTKTMVKKMWAMAHGLWCVSTNAMARGLRCGVASVTARGAQCCSFEEARRLRSTWLPIIRGGASHRDEKWMFKRIACVAGAGFLFLGWQLDRACHCEQGSVPWRTALPPLLAKRLIEIAFTGTDLYGTIPEEEEDAVNAVGHWAYGEISPEGVGALLARMDVGPDSVFYDLGSGLGKVLAQALLASEARRVVGIEMASTRHRHAWQACERLSKLLDLVSDPLLTMSPTDVPPPQTAVWFEEDPGALSPSMVLRAVGRELRVVHGDCLVLPIHDATHVYMANLTWPAEVIHAPSPQRTRPMATAHATHGHSARGVRHAPLAAAHASTAPATGGKYGGRLREEE